MSLGRKTLALFLALGLAICAGSYLALRLSVLPAFEEFEYGATADALARVESILEGDLHALEVINIEYSAWDDTVHYIETGNPEFVEENLSPGYWQSITASSAAYSLRPIQEPALSSRAVRTSPVWKPSGRPT